MYKCANANIIVLLLRDISLELSIINLIKRPLIVKINFINLFKKNGSSRRNSNPKHESQNVSILG
jgi:hypothetical protein